MPEDSSPIRVRGYGDSGRALVLLHGGPGAAGYLAPVARNLSAFYHVFEPLQRRRKDEPLTVKVHIQDLHDVIVRYCGDEHPLLVGHSWGAMLALAYAAEHPDVAMAIALVGCGTFDVHSRRRLMQTLGARTTPAVADRLRQAGRTIRDPDVRLCVTGRILERLYSFDMVPHEDETLEYDALGQREAWTDMLRLQREGAYPAAFCRIQSPVLMVHGADDPHPGAMVRQSLLPALPRLEYVELQKCGHFPWLERHASGAFFAVLTAWLAEHA